MEGISLERIHGARQGLSRGTTPAIIAIAAAATLAYATLHPATSHAMSYGSAPYETQFLHALGALRHGNDAAFGRHADKLRDSPLYPYLLYWQLKKRLSLQSPLSIETFLHRYADTPLAPMLRQQWLQLLAQQRRWEEYLHFFEEEQDAAELRCLYHYAQYKTGATEAAWEGAKTMWLVGHSQDAACDPLFAAWRQTGGITRELRWQRISLAMANGDTTIANHVARLLASPEQRLVRLWQQAYDKPALLKQPPLRADTPINRMIIIDTLKHRAVRAPNGTTALWQKIAPQYSFSPQQLNTIARAIGIGHTYANDARALSWFAQLPRQERDLELCNYALRVALRTGEWGSALAWLEVMPEGHNRSSMSRYWRARIYENMGYAEPARYLFKELSKERDYYGFLAADRLYVPYNLSHTDLRVSNSVLKRVAMLPGIRRAQGLYYLGFVGSARREWSHAITTLEYDELLAASKLADAWGWEDRALLTLAHADHFDDLNIRFPLSFHETVFKEAKRRAIDPALVYAVVRQESAMMPAVRSHVGALGLMQVMPETGKSIARELKLAHYDTRQLLDPDTNIHFGSYYLGQSLQRFDDNPVMATAAYNAGPHRIRKWTPRQGELAADIWVDTIPFDETRKYVRRVLAYSVFYDRRLEQPFTRLSERMRPVRNAPMLRGPSAVIARDDTQ